MEKSLRESGFRNNPGCGQCAHKSAKCPPMNSFCKIVKFEMSQGRFQNRSKSGHFLGGTQVPGILRNVVESWLPDSIRRLNQERYKCTNQGLHLRVNEMYGDYYIENMLNCRLLGFPSPDTFSPDKQFCRRKQLSISSRSWDINKLILFAQQCHLVNQIWTTFLATDASCPFWSWNIAMWILFSHQRHLSSQFQHLLFSIRSVLSR